MKRYSSLAVCALGLLLLAWAFWLEPASLRNEDYDLAIPHWPQACDGLRIAILTDLHVGSPFNGLGKLERIVELTRKSGSDLILLAGDYVIHGVLGGKFIAPEALTASLRKLSAPLGVFAVLGNHDWWYDASATRRALAAAGITVLEDSAVSIQSAGCRFWLAGIGDFWESDHNIAAALAAVPATAAVIALTHNPDIFPEIPPRVALTIAGHTHGGQVYMPFIGRPVVPSEYGERYAIGHIVESGRHLFVSPGLGTSILPVRFLVPPEISVLAIRARKNPAPPSASMLPSL